MKENLKTLLIATLTLLSVLLLSREMGWINPKSNTIETTKENTTDLDKACKKLIHRIWLDNPIYVEDVLWETDEMLELDHLLGGNWGNTFDLQTEQDTISYSRNCLKEPDKLPSKAKHDKLPNQMKYLPPLRICVTIILVFPIILVKLLWHRFFKKSNLMHDR